MLIRARARARVPAYAKPDAGAPHVFAVPADGSGAPRKLFMGGSPTLTTRGTVSRSSSPVP
ncbi:hypothetical protein [Streptomyces sp. NPDC005017]|uniref:hypothetical protein n=1 Tax=Streptomyces sp. NPDC005017 TaxID=3364706 RepID=UPI00369AEE46